MKNLMLVLMIICVICMTLALDPTPAQAQDSNPNIYDLMLARQAMDAIPDPVDRRISVGFGTAYYAADLASVTDAAKTHDVSGFYYAAGLTARTGRYSTFTVGAATSGSPGKDLLMMAGWSFGF